MGIGNHHLAMTTLIMAVGKNHMLLLKVVDYHVLRKGYLRSLKEFVKSHPNKEYINYKEKNSNFVVETPSRHHLHQVIKVNITNDKTR